MTEEELQKTKDQFHLLEKKFKKLLPSICQGCPLSEKPFDCHGCSKSEHLHEEVFHDF